MKILQLCNKAPFPAQDGSSIAIQNMALGLINSGAEVRILTLNTQKHYKSPKLLPFPFQLNKNYESFNCNTNTSILGALVNLFTNKSYFVSRFYQKAFGLKLRSLLQEFNPDIVQLEGLSMGVYLNDIQNNSRAKIVLRAHNIEHLIWQRYILNIKNPLKKWYFNVQTKRLKSFETRILQSIDKIVAITPQDENVLRNLSKRKIMTALTGVNLTEYKVSRSKEFVDCSIFHFGSMDWIPNREGVDWFLKECWDSILEAFPNCKFVLAGREIPDYYKGIKHKNIVIKENVSHPSDVYNTYNIMIVPILSGSGLRIKIVEGMSFGKAIVSTSIGAEGIRVEQKKNLVLADDSSTFTDSILSLLKDQELVKDLERNARIFAESTFDNDKICMAVYNSYLDLIE